MSSLMIKLVNTLDQCFERIDKILTEKNVKSTMDMKVCVYRNWNSTAEKVLETTSFETKPNNLRKFVQRISVDGGWGNEALEVFYQHINKIDEVDQIILIGDAPANERDETTSRRQSKSEKYWNDHKFPLCYAEDEVNKIIGRKIPIHSFYLNRYCQKYFESVSSRTSGKS